MAYFHTFYLDGKPVSLVVVSVADEYEVGEVGQGVRGGRKDGQVS